MILLNQLVAVSARVLMPKTGAWLADVDVDLDLVPILPTGPAILTLGTTILRGTIDDRASGRLGSKARIRLVAGGGGWDKPVPALQIHNDAGVFSTAVYAVTAAAVGEAPVVELGPPTRYGVDYVRTKGPASRVFAGVDWWVDILGITHTGPRIPLPAPVSPIAEITNWHPLAKVAEVSSDILIVPGMILADPLRFGVATVDDVEHTFDQNGAKAIAWCSTPSLSDATEAVLGAKPASSGTKLVKALGALARESSQVSTLRKYAYRVVVQGPDGRLNLQCTDLLGESPLFLVLIDIWAGIPGLSCKLSPASVVLVSFVNGDPARPVVVGFDPKNPPALEVSLEAVRVALGLGTAPVVRLSPMFATWLASVGSATGAGPPPVDLASTKTFTD